MKRAIAILVIALCAMLSPLAAQQAAGPAPVSGATAAPVSAANPALPGPRLQPEWRRFEPSVADSSTSLMSRSGRHTIVLSTLALILVVVIVVLLVVK